MKKGLRLFGKKSGRRRPADRRDVRRDYEEDYYEEDDREYDEEYYEESEEDIDDSYEDESSDDYAEDEEYYDEDDRYYEEGDIPDDTIDMEKAMSAAAASNVVNIRDYRGSEKAEELLPEEDMPEDISEDNTSEEDMSEEDNIRVNTSKESYEDEADNYYSEEELDDYEDEEFDREYGGDGYDDDLVDNYENGREDGEDGYRDEDDYPEDDDYRDEDYRDDDEDYDTEYEDDRRGAVIGTYGSGKTYRKRSSGRNNKKKGAGLTLAAGKVVEFVRNTGAVERIAMVVALLLLVCGVALASFYSKALNKKNSLDEFAQIGQSLSETTIIGESGLIAMADAQRAKLLAAQMEEEALEEEKEEEVLGEVKTVAVKVTLTSIKSDMKVKFINSETKKLVGDVHFEIDVVTPDGTKVTYDDHDKDGIIYKKDLTAGKYKITPKALSSEYDKYTLDTSTQTLNVKDTVEMKAVDVSDEIKKESQVNAAVEDTAEKTAIESQLTDTVEWVESNQNSSGSQDKYKYEEIDRSDIADPYQSGSTKGTATGTNMYTAARTKVVTSEVALGRAEAGNEGSVDEGSGDSSGSDNSGSGSGEGSSGNSGESGSGGDQGGESGEQPQELYTIGLNVTSLDIKVGETKNIEANGPSSPSFKSDNDSVATVSSDGTVKGVGAGNAKITISADGYKDASVDVHVTAEEKPETNKKDFKIKVTAVELIVGQTDKITFSEKTSGAKFESEDPSIAKVAEDGTITAVKVGSTKIKVTGEGYNDASVSVKVTDDGKYTMELNATKLTLKVGGIEKITAKGPESVTYKSSKESVATVSKDGTVKGVAAGTATITVSSKNYKDATVEVKVESNKSVLKDKKGNVVYVKNDDGSYREATYDDYYSKKKLYLRKENQDGGVRHGWWTINGNTYYYDKNGNYVTGEQVIQGAKYSFNGDGVLSSSSGVMGIDVSKWNGNINWSQVKNSGVRFVIIRCGYRGSSAGALIEDPKFRANIQGAQNAGLKVGVYFFTQAVNEVEAVEEASMVISLIRGYSISYPVYLDVEGSGGRGDKISPSQRTANIKAFCGTIQNAGYRAGVYANKTWFTSQINTGSLTNYKIWLAQYASAVTYNSTRYDMWQYTSKGKISGISGNVDMNISYN